MSFFLRFLSGVLAELKATIGVWTLLRKRFWSAYALLVLATLSVPFLPGPAAPIGAGLMVLGLGLGAIFSGSAAKRVRRWGWVHYPDGPEVVPYLSQALAILLSPPFFLAMAALFQSLGQYLPELFALVDRHKPGVYTLAPVTWTNALGLAVDNVLYTQIFFDFFECFHIRFGPRPVGALAPTLVFLVRTLLDIAFIKLTVQLIRAAYFRALDFGRGGDLVAQTQAACTNEDVSAVRLHSRDVGQSVRAAADDLRLHAEGNGPQGEQARLGLRAMKDFAIAHFESRALTQLGDERLRTEALVDQLTTDDGPGPEPKPTPWYGRLLLLVIYVALAGLTYLAWRLTAVASWPLTAGLVVLQGWFLVRPRWWLDRLDAWGVLPSPSPARLPFRVLLWLAALTPLFLVNAAEVVYLVGRQVPEVFHAATADDVTPAAAGEFVLENLLRAQIFADTVEIYNVRVVDLHQEGLLGGTLTFLLRLVFNIGLLAVLVPFLLERFNRWFRGVQTRPDAELLLRREARACGPHSALLVAYYFGQVRDWFVEAMNANQDRPALLAALAASGFVRDFQARYPDGPRPTDDPVTDIARRLERGQTLFLEGRLPEGEQEVRRAMEALDQLAAQDRTDLDEVTAFARFVQGQLAMLRAQTAEAETHLREAHALIRKLGGDEMGSAHSARLAEILDSLAVVVGQSVVRAPDALRYAERSTELFRHFVAQGQFEYREALASSLGTRGQMLNVLQRWPESVESLRNAILILEEIQAENAAASEDEGIFGPSGPRRGEVRDGLSQRLLELASVYRELRQFEDSAGEARKAIALLEDLLRAGTTQARDPLARAMNLLGLSLMDGGKSDEAQPAFDRARQLCETLILEGHGHQRRMLAPILNNLGLIQLNQGQVTEAEARFRRAIDIVESLAQDGQLQQQELLVTVYNNLAQALMHQKKMHEAEVEVGKAIEVGRSLVLAGQTTLRDELALVLSNLGDLKTHRYEWEQAVEAFRESASWYAQVVDGGAEQYRPLRARALDRLSTSLRLFGEIDEAEVQGQAAVEQFRVLVNAGQARYRPELAGAIRTLGLAYHANRNFDEALGCYQEANLLVGSDSADDRLARSILLVDIAGIYEAQGQPQDALQSLDRAILLQVQLVDAGRKDMQAALARLLDHRGDLLAREGDLASALTAYREAVRRLKPLVDEGQRNLREDLATFHADVARSLAALGERGWDDSFPAALALLGELVREGDPGAAESYYPVTEALVEQLTRAGRFDEAELILRQTAGIYAAASVDPTNHRARLGEARTRFALAQHLAETGKQPEFRAEADTTLTLLEALLRLPEPPDRAPRQYRDHFGSLIRLLVHKGWLDDAATTGQRVLAFLEGSTATAALVEALEACAGVAVARGDREAALTLLRRAEEHLPRDPFDLYSLNSPAVGIFQLLAEMGRRDEAAALANEAIVALTARTAESQPEGGTLAGWLRLLGDLQTARGDTATAQTTLRQAMDLLVERKADPADVAPVYASLFAAAPAASLPEALRYVQSLDDPKALSPADVIAVRTLVEVIHQARPDDPLWAALRERWANLRPE